jgi:hypothetical protein
MLQPSESKRNSASSPLSGLFCASSHNPELSACRSRKLATPIDLVLERLPSLQEGECGISWRSSEYAPTTAPFKPDCHITGDTIERLPNGRQCP